MPPSRNPFDACALNVRLVRRLEARDEAGSDAIGARGAWRRHQRRSGIVVREDAVEHLLAVFVEVEVPHAGGEIELAGGAQRGFAEHGVLVQIVGEIRIEQHVTRRAESYRGDA
jgi:hypothetical protein